MSPVHPFPQQFNRRAFSGGREKLKQCEGVFTFCPVHICSCWSLRVKQCLSCFAFFFVWSFERFLVFSFRFLRNSELFFVSWDSSRFLVCCAALQSICHHTWNPLVPTDSLSFPVVYWHVKKSTNIRNTVHNIVLRLVSFVWEQTCLLCETSFNMILHTVFPMFADFFYRKYSWSVRTLEYRMWSNDSSSGLFTFSFCRKLRQFSVFLPQ